MELPLDALPISPRLALRPGGLFRVARGSGPVYRTTGQPLGVAAGEFRCLRVWRDSARPKRVYCDAVECGSGRTHTLYVAGPPYRSHAIPHLVCRPYRIRLSNPAARPRRPRRQA